MPPGNNKGGNLNVFIFEVGMITRDPFGILPDIITTVAIHPLVVNPSTIRYSDQTRSSVTETPGGAVYTQAGRALRNGQFQGSFGVESRGLGLIIGTGERRFEKFYHEVVRLSEAIDKAGVDAEKDILRSPELLLTLIPYQEENSSFFINYYDFWHDISFNALINQFGWTRQHRGGPRIDYQMSVREIGPIITGGLGTALINGLFQALTAWDDVNELIKSYTPDAITGGIVDAGGILAGQFTDTINAVVAQQDGATGAVNGYADPFAASKSRNASSTGGSAETGATAPTVPTTEGTNEDAQNGTIGLSGHLGNAERLSTLGAELLETFEAQGPSTALDRVGGEIDWGSLEDEGSLPGVDAADAHAGLSEVIAAAQFQPAVGSLYGMSRSEYAAYIGATGRGGRDVGLAGTIEHIVSIFDTAQTISERYNVSWSKILRLNQLLPDEALLAGTRLLIPKQRSSPQQNQIAGLPVFGSHAGKEAWGRDLALDRRVDADGRYVIIEGEEALTQGIDWLIDLYGADLVRVANDTPDVVRLPMLRKRIASILTTDRRIASIDRIDILGGSSLAVEVTASAVNGGTIRTGSTA
jgi:LysM domain